MPDTRWILPALQKLRDWPPGIPLYPIEWVCVDPDTKEIVLIKFKKEKA